MRPAHRSSPPNTRRPVPLAGADGPADTPSAPRRPGRIRSGRSPGPGTPRSSRHRSHTPAAAPDARSPSARSQGGQRPAGVPYRSLRRRAGRRRNRGRPAGHESGPHHRSGALHQPEPPITRLLTGLTNYRPDATSAAAASRTHPNSAASRSSGSSSPTGLRTPRPAQQAPRPSRSGP